MTDDLERRLREDLEEIQQGDRPLPWIVHSGCSYRRIASEPTRENLRSFPDGNVLHAYNQRCDGHPDLSMGERQLEALVRIVNAAPAVADEIARLRAENEALREALDELPARAYERGYRDGREDAPSIYHPDVMREGFAQWQADNRAALSVLEPRIEQLEREQAEGWRDIATAPVATAKESGNLRVLVVGGIHKEATIVLADGEWWRMRAREGGKGVPTHWRPLPPPPTGDRG